MPFDCEMSRGFWSPTHRLAAIQRASKSLASRRRALGLDESSGWVILSEHNVDEWSNAGLSKPPGQRDVYSYGFVPPGRFVRINAHFLELARSKMSRAVRR